MYLTLSPATQRWFDCQHPLAVETSNYCESLEPGDEEAARTVLDRRLTPAAKAWLDDLLFDKALVLPLLERCCLDGKPLPADVRLTRLVGVPAELVAFCEEIIRTAEADEHYMRALMVPYRMVRIERARRTGSVDL